MHEIGKLAARQETPEDCVEVGTLHEGYEGLTYKKLDFDRELIKKSC